VLKTVWTWLCGGSDRSAFKDEELLQQRRKTLTDSARRQAAQLRADQEAGRSEVGPWADSAGTSRRRPAPGRILAMTARQGARSR
jgi:hypothetical protein